MHVLYRDEVLLAVDKPSGMIVHRGAANDDYAVADYVRDVLVHAPVHALHRLDRGTSGVLLFATDRDAARTMHDAFADGRIEKTYLALVRGIPRPASGVIDHPIPKGEGLERVPAVSEYETLGVCLERYAWVRVHPKTGRYHQVRRHMSHLSCPLIGDTTYGKGEHNRLWRARGLSRLALHASAIAFVHPVSGVRLQIEAPLAKDLADALANAGL